MAPMAPIDEKALTRGILSLCQYIEKTKND